MSIVLFSGFILAMMAGIPITFALLLGSVAAILMTDLSLMAIPQRMVPVLSNAIVLVAVPLFLLAGNIIGQGGMGDRLIKLANMIVGRTRGGLSSANIVTSMFFGGISGSATADTSAVGSIMIPAMEKQGYDRSFATAVTVVSSPLGTIIPPSIIIIVYCWITELSIATMFAAGYLPALVLGLGLILVGYIISVKNNYPLAPKYSKSEMIRTIIETIPGLLMPIFIIGGILSGVFTATESAGIAVVYGFLVAKYFYKDLTWEQMPKILKDTANMTGVVLLIIAFASIFAWLISYDRLPYQIAEAISAMNMGLGMFLLVYIGLLIFLGTFLSPSEAIIISTPILFPVGMLLGMGPIHFGMVTVVTLALGHVTPPVGLCLFVGSAISGLSIGEITKSLIPFYLVCLVVVFLVAYFPQISLLVPQLLGLI